MLTGVCFFIHFHIYIIYELGHGPKSVSHQVVATLLRQLDFCILVNRNLFTNHYLKVPMFLVAHYFPMACVIGTKRWQASIVVGLLLVNRWLWPVSQSDVTPFPRWQPPLSAASRISQ